MVSGRMRGVILVLFAVLTVAAAFGVSTRLRLDPNVASLLPERGESAALRQYLRAFGGSDLAMVLVTVPSEVGRGGPPADAAAVEAVEEVARGIAADLGAQPSVKVAAAGLDTEGQLAPMLAWRHADGPTRQKLAAALTPDGMRERLRGSRSLLLAPGAGAAAERIAVDPLRLSQLLAESGQVGSGFQTQADGSFATDDGHARLVLVFPAGQALRGADAKAFVHDAQAVLAKYRASHPEVYIGLTGGHAIAAATETMLIRDLSLSGTVSMILASLAFMLTFRRLRALFAVMPPLLLGTLWTAGIASALPSGLSSIAVAFMSVVIGVGVDTGVHVYAALLEARQEGLEPKAAARRARQRTQKPVLVAALTAGAAFGALGLSEIAALRQLGLLCAGGETLTAIAIVVVTPELGALLETKPPPPYRAPVWTGWIDKLTKHPWSALAWGVATLAPTVALGVGYAPRVADAIVAMRPEGLEPLTVQQEIYDVFGGRRGQWVVLVADETRMAARERTDRIAEALAGGDDVESLDAITSIAPSPATQAKRFDARDALDLPAKADELEEALVDVGFNASRFEGALEAMRDPPRTLVKLEDIEARENAAILVQRYLGQDGETPVVVSYLLPRRVAGDPAASRAHEAAIEATVAAADPGAKLTGYSRLERSLRDSLLVDMPKIGAVAGMLVILALALALRSFRDVVIAAAVVAAEIGVVLFLVRALEVPLHAYDALVLPVLLGITVDEGMFLLYRAREADVSETLRREGPPVATTALTTAAGFGGLIVCDFDGLRHLGMVGAIGSLTGLLVALVIVPAGLRLSKLVGARPAA